MPVEIKSVIEPKLDKIRGMGLIDGARQFVDTDGKTIQEVLLGLYMVQEQYRIDWEAILALAEQANGKELLPEPIMDLILKNCQLDYLTTEINHLWDWVDGLDELIKAAKFAK